MPQTTGQVTGSDFKIEVSTNGTTWTDIGGSSNAIAAPEQSRDIGETYTATGNAPIITVGPRQRLELDVDILYTEVTGEAFEVVRAAFEGNGLLWMRYSPKGGDTGDFVFTTANGSGIAAAGIISNFTYPGPDAAESNPLMAGFTISAAALLKSVQA